MKFSYRIFVCVILVKLELGPVQQIPKPVISLTVPITSVSTAAWNRMSLVLSWLV